MTILITIALTVSVMLLILMYSVCLANYIQMQKVTAALVEMTTLARQESQTIQGLTKYITDLTIVIENLSEVTEGLGQAMYENSFKILRDGPRMFSGYSPDEIAEKMQRADYELSEEDINQLRDLFMGMEDEDDGEETP